MVLSMVLHVSHEGTVLQSDWQVPLLSDQVAVLQSEWVVLPLGEQVAVLWSK